MLFKISEDHVLVIEQVAVQGVYPHFRIDQKLQPVRRRIRINPAM